MLLFIVIAMMVFFLFGREILTGNSKKSTMIKVQLLKESSGLPQNANGNSKIVVVEGRKKISLMNENENGLITAEEIYTENNGEIFGRSIFVDENGNLNFVRKLEADFYIDKININGTLLESKKILVHISMKRIKDVLLGTDGKFILINVTWMTFPKGDLYYAYTNELKSGLEEGLELSENANNFNLLHNICDSGAAPAMQVSPDMNYISFIEILEKSDTEKEKLLWKNLQVYDIRKNKKVLSFRVSDEGYGCFNQVWSPSGEKILFIREYPGNKYEVCIIDLSSGKSSTILNPMEELAYLDLDWKEGGIVVTDGKRGIFFSRGKSSKYGLKLLKMSENIDHYARGRISPDGKKIMFFGSKRDESFLFIYNLETQKISSIKLKKDIDEYMGGWIEEGQRSLIMDSTNPVYFPF